MSRGPSARSVARRVFSIIAALAALSAPVPVAAETGSVSGLFFKDMNRDGVRQASEEPLPDIAVYLHDAAGELRAYGGTDAAGRYSIGDVPAGEYVVKMDSQQWWQIMHDWVPTTTGSVFPEQHVTVAGPTEAHFGWRPLVKSADLAHPLDTYTTPSGLRVEMFNDAMPAEAIADALAQGELPGDEAQYTTIRFAYNSASFAATYTSEFEGMYTSYESVVYVSYGSWLDSRDTTLFHEYGHSWGLYHAYMVQQDSELTGYLQVRGLLGDPRLDSSHAWSRVEMLAEDYRQLFGSASAREQAQENREIPPAGDVPGLRDYLGGEFMAATASSEPSPSPSPSPTPSEPSEPAESPAPLVDGLAVSPEPVVDGGTIEFSLGTAATVSVSVVDDRGRTVRSLRSDVNLDSGLHAIAWDRRDDRSRIVRAGTYTAVVHAVTDGATTTEQRAFGVVDATTTSGGSGGGPKKR